MATPLISIIIPIYNVEKYLKRCVDSVINQSYRNLEIILVDDGSPDQCGKICDAYKKEDCRIKVLHKGNGGLSDARNAGTAAACGEYIFYLDSDDYILEDTIEYLFGLMEYNQAQITCANMFKTESLEKALPEDSLKYEEKTVSGRDACKEIFGPNYSVMVIACCKLIKTDIAKSYLFPKGRIQEDEATTYKFFYKADSVVISSKKCYGYYQNPGSIMHRKRERTESDAYWAFHCRIDFFLERNDLELVRLSVDRTAAYLIDCNFAHLPDARVLGWNFLKKYFWSNKMSFEPKLKLLVSTAFQTMLPMILKVHLLIHKRPNSLK